MRCLPIQTVCLLVILGLNAIHLMRAEAELYDRTDLIRSPSMLRREADDQLDLAVSLYNSESENLQEAYAKFEIMLQFGAHDKAKEAVREAALFQSQFDGFVSDLAFSMYHRSTSDNYQAWDVAQYILETFDIYIDDMDQDECRRGPSVRIRLLAFWDAEGERTPEENDAWLVERITHAKEVEEMSGDGSEDPQDVAPRPDHIFSPVKFWTAARLYYLNQHGLEQPFIQELVEAVRHDPTDLMKVNDLIDLLCGSLNPETIEAIDLTWILQECDLRKTRDVYQLAGRLWGSGKTELDLSLLRLALEIPLTDEELLEIEAEQQAFAAMLAVAGRTPETVDSGFDVEKERIIYRLEVLERMEYVLQQSQQESAAALIASEASRLRKEHELDDRPSYTLEEIERNILQLGKTSAEDPEYWLTRADFYGRDARNRRSEPMDREQMDRFEYERGKASFMALRLCEIGSDDEQIDLFRARALEHYTRHLQTARQFTESFEILEDEFRSAPPDSHSAQFAINEFRGQNREQVSCLDEFYWNWLYRRSSWGNVEDGLLRHLLLDAVELSEKTATLPDAHEDQGAEEQASSSPEGLTENSSREGAEVLEFAIQQAAALVRDHDPERTIAIIKVMERLESQECPLRLLQELLDRSDLDDKHRERAFIMLLNTRFRIGEFSEAERDLQAASSYFSPRVCQARGDYIALHAFLAGETVENQAESLERYCRGKLSGGLVNPSKYRSLCESGLEEQAQAYYAELERRLPDPVNSRRIADILSGKEPTAPVPERNVPYR